MGIAIHTGYSGSYFTQLLEVSGFRTRTVKKAYWTALHSTNGNDPKRNPGVFEGKKVLYSVMAESISWSQPDWAAFHSLKTKLKTEQIYLSNYIWAPENGGLRIKMVVIPKYFMSISSWLFHFNSILVAYSAEIIKNCVSVQIYMDLTVCVYIKLFKTFIFILKAKTVLHYW